MRLGTYARYTTVSAQHIDELWAVLSTSMPSDLIAEMTRNGYEPWGIPLMHKELVILFDEETGDVFEAYNVACRGNYLVEGKAEQ